jgi:hypothetical protein
MRSTVAATTAIVLALAATTASAGVVISQDVVINGQNGERKYQQTVMLQGHKQKVVTDQREIITDLDAGKTFILAPLAKRSGELPFPPRGVVARVMAREGMFLGYEKSAGTNKVAGYDCQDYAGSAQAGHFAIKATQCVASAAAGAREYIEFRKTLTEKIKDTPMASTGGVPDGIPVSSTLTVKQIPVPIPPGFDPQLAAKVKAQMANAKPDVTTITVTKIEAKDLPADTFVVPADFKKTDIPMPAKPGAAPAAPEPAPASPPAAH